MHYLGQKYVESPFEAPGKVVEVLNYAKPFVDALNSIPKAEVIAQPSWELYHMSPGEFDERLKWVNTIIFADVETKCLMLHPDFFTRAKWGDNPVTFPDRFDSLREWIEKGDTLNRLLDLRQLFRGSNFNCNNCGCICISC